MTKQHGLCLFVSVNFSCTLPSMVEKSGISWYNLREGKSSDNGTMKAMLA